MPRQADIVSASRTTQPQMLEGDIYTFATRLPHLLRANICMSVCPDLSKGGGGHWRISQNTASKKMYLMYNNDYLGILDIVSYLSKYPLQAWEGEEGADLSSVLCTDTHGRWKLRWAAS